MRIAVGRTQAEAKVKAKEALAKHGKAELAESIKRKIADNGVAPGLADLQPEEPKQTFSVTTDDGVTVEVSCTPSFRHHLEFRGEIASHSREVAKTPQTT